jgi:hypothetical protein
MMRMQQMGCIQPGDAPSYDRDTQTESPLTTLNWWLLNKVN